MESNKASDQLFVRDGKYPIKFSMRPCDERVKLKPIIEQGGGIITSKSSLESIRLAEPNSKVFGDNCISSKYIWDCFTAKKLLDIENYRIKQHVSSDVSDISDSECDFKTSRRQQNCKPSGKNLRGRREYILADDKKIIEYICSSRRFKEIKGRRLWQAMETLEILPNRTWQSMKERFVKQILPNLDSYNIPIHDLQNLKIHNDKAENVDKHKKTNVKKALSPFTPEIDSAILNSILKRNDFKMIDDKELWKSIELDIVNDVQSWEDLRERFLHHIVPNIASYKVAEKYKKALTRLLAIVPLINGKISNRNKILRKAPLPLTTSKYFNNKPRSVFEDNSAEVNDIQPDVAIALTNGIEKCNTPINSPVAIQRDEEPVFNSNKSDDEETLQLELSEDSNSCMKSKNNPTISHGKRSDLLNAHNAQVIVLEMVSDANDKPTMRLSMCALPDNELNNVTSLGNLSAHIDRGTVHHTSVQDKQTENNDLQIGNLNSRNTSCESQLEKVVHDLKQSVLREKENLNTVQPPENSLTLEPDPEERISNPKRLMTSSPSLKRGHSSLHQTIRDCDRLEEQQLFNPRTKVLQRKRFRLHYGLENNNDSHSSDDDSDKTQKYVDDDDDDDDDNAMVTSVVKEYCKLPENPDDCSEADDQTIIQILKLMLKCTDDEVKELCRGTNCNLTLILQMSGSENNHS